METIYRISRLHLIGLSQSNFTALFLLHKKLIVLFRDSPNPQYIVNICNEMF